MNDEVIYCGEEFFQRLNNLGVGYKFPYQKGTITFIKADYLKGDQLLTTNPVLVRVLEQLKDQIN